MMILAVNIGNTNIRAALGHADGTIADQTVFHIDKGNILDQIEAGLSPAWDQIEGSIIATVVPEHTHAVVSALKSKINGSVKRIDIKNCGSLRVDQYEGLLGEDRVVCCAQALQKFSTPFVVIDFGTATTINVVNGDGAFIGGAILAGLQTGLDALTRNTAQLPQISGSDAKKTEILLIGKNTKENLHSGAVIGLACAMEGFLFRIKKEMGYCEKTPVIVTGGHAPAILPYCQFDYIHEPSLLLEGLLTLYRGQTKVDSQGILNI
ncbi:MAG: type III pantothenate kinase [Defluviitaleaceae bacterium]|nr:type III pantothenate kinase [Defluviitaleaceae bacterium]